jgi:hypothetical protein
MSKSQNIRTNSSAFEPFQRKGVVNVFTDIEDDPVQQNLTEIIINKRNSRKFAFSKLREMFKCNVSKRIIPCLKSSSQETSKNENFVV